MIQRKCAELGIPEVQALEKGMDFRLPQYRREVFLRFYEFHTKYKSHPGGVYYAIPNLIDRFKLDKEQAYWLCFVNGISQNIVTTWKIVEQIPSVPKDLAELAKLSQFFRANYEKFGWDTDRRYVKNKFEKAVLGYMNLLAGRTQEEYFNGLCSSENPEANFRNAWFEVNNHFEYFGRLSTFSYLEYLKIAGLNIECDSLFLDDISGSKSHRNGLCRVLGLDEYDWHDKLNPGFDGKYSPELLTFLEEEGKVLLEEAKARFEGASNFTLESTLCCFKSWSRPNRRYANVYNDMFYERIKYAEKQWGKPETLFWEIRKACLPEYLRLEDNPKDPGFSKIKQNLFRATGQVVMMDKDWSCFENDLLRAKWLEIPGYAEPK